MIYSFIFNFKFTKKMYEFDGKDWKDTDLDVKAIRWKSPGCIVVKDEIILVGGYKKEPYGRQTSEIFNIQKRSWRQGPDLPYGLYGSQTVKAKEGMKYIAYLIGGINGKTTTTIYGLTNDLERFEDIGNILQARYNHVALAIPENIIEKCAMNFQYSIFHEVDFDDYK